jgi:hypothetical protein
MPGTVLNDAINEALKATSARLQPLGFVRRGKTFRIVKDNNCGVVEFQRSTTNSRDRLRFTVNLGVVCGHLLDSWQPELRRSGSSDAHVREGLGEYCLSVPTNGGN